MPIYQAKSPIHTQSRPRWLCLRELVWAQRERKTHSIIEFSQISTLDDHNSSFLNREMEQSWIHRLAVAKIPVKQESRKEEQWTPASYLATTHSERKADISKLLSLQLLWQLPHLAQNWLWYVHVRCQLQTIQNFSTPTRKRLRPSIRIYW